MRHGLRKPAGTDHRKKHADLQDPPRKEWSDPSRFEANLLSIEVNPVRSEMDRQGFEVELPGIESSHQRPEMEWFRAQVDRETMLEWLVAWEEVDGAWRAKDEPANLASPIDFVGPLRQKTCPLVG